MQIKIAKKLQCFSFKSKTTCSIPGSSWKVTLFPTRLELVDLNNLNQVIDLTWDTNGPVSEFRVEQDLERGFIDCSGKSIIGFFKLRLEAKEGKITVSLKRGPNNGLFLKSEILQKVEFLQPKESWILSENIQTVSFSPEDEKLSFGVHKALEMEKISSRVDLQELFPIWLKLSQKTPGSYPDVENGTARLLKFPEERDKIFEQYGQLFKAGFDHFFIPKLFDDSYLGYTDPNEKITSNLSPLIIIKNGGAKIRSLFFEQEGNTFSILPKLLNLFPCGRFINVSCEEFGKMDIEWSKQRISKVIFHSYKNGIVIFKHPSAIRSCRLRRSRNEKGIVLSNPQEVFVEKNQIYLFDRFER